MYAYFPLLEATSYRTVSRVVKSFVSTDYLFVCLMYFIITVYTAVIHSNKSNELVKQFSNALKFACLKCV